MCSSDLSDIFVENMEAIGIEVQVDAMERPWDRLNYDHDFSIAQFAWIETSKGDNPYELRSYLVSGDGQNVAQYNNPTADQFLDLAALHTTRAEKLPYLAHYQRTVMADLPMLLLFERIEIPDQDGDGVPDDKDACPDQSSFGYDADLDGCLDTTTTLKALVHTLRTSGQITKLSTETTLLRFVTNAEAKLAVKNYSGAITDLRSFITFVQKQTIVPGKTGGTIKPEAAAKLIAYAESLIRWIGDLDNLRLGVLLEYSADFPWLVQAEDEGLRLAIEQANNAGGVLGQPVLLSQRDSSHGDEGLAVAAASDLANYLKVNAILGPVTSGTTNAILSSVIVPSGVVDVSPSSTSPTVGATYDNGLLFRMSDSDANRGWAAARQACNDGNQTAAIIVWGDSPWQYIDNAFRDEFESCGAGTNTVLRTVEFTGNAGPALRAALGSDPGNIPDVIFVAVYFDDPQLINLVQAGVCVLGPDDLRATQHKWIFSSKLPDDFVPKVLGGIPCGANVGPGEFAGYKSVAPTYELDYGSSAFQSAYSAEYSANPQMFANSAYDAAVLVMLAAEEAHSTDRALIQAHMLTVASGGTAVYDLATALTMVRLGTDIDWQGTYALQVGGIPYIFNHDFTPEGETISPHAVFVLQADGSLTLAEVLEP